MFKIEWNGTVQGDFLLTLWNNYQQIVIKLIEKVLPGTTEPKSDDAKVAGAKTFCVCAMYVTVRRGFKLK